MPRSLGVVPANTPPASARTTPVRRAAKARATVQIASLRRIAIRVSSPGSALTPGWGLPEGEQSKRHPASPTCDGPKPSKRRQEGEWILLIGRTDGGRVLALV